MRSKVEEKSILFYLDSKECSGNHWLMPDWLQISKWTRLIRTGSVRSWLFTRPFLTISKDNDRSRIKGVSKIELAVVGGEC